MLFWTFLRSGLFTGTPAADGTICPDDVISETQPLPTAWPSTLVDTFDLPCMGAVMDVTPQWARLPALPWKSSDAGDPDEAGAERPPRSDSPSSTPRAAARKGHILLVDDDESVRETLAELLEIAGFSPIQAADTQQALTILRQVQDIGALVTDLTMPGDDGIALIRQAREIKPNLPAILLTGYAEEGTSIATVAGANFHVLRKPVESDYLVEQLELMMANSGA
jgi:CheY-like chemotaxis protein